MTRSPLIRRYARALFEYAREHSCLESLEKDVQVLKRCLESHEVCNLLLDPRISRNREAIWSRILGPGAEPILKKFILFLYAKGRISLLREILSDFLSLCDEARGVLSVLVESAHPLTSGQSQALVAKLASRVGLALRAEYRLDPSLIGGFRIRARDTVYDASIRRQLERMHRKFISA